MQNEIHMDPQVGKAAHLEDVHVAITLQELEVDISIAGLDGIHDLTKISSFPDVWPKGRTAIHNLVSRLHVQTQLQATC